MRRKRIKYVANIDFGYRSITDAKQHIKIFLKSLLSQIGLRFLLYLEAYNNQKQSEISNRKSLFISVF